MLSAMPARTPTHPTRSLGTTEALSIFKLMHVHHYMHMLMHIHSYMHSMALRPHSMQLSDSRGLGYCGSRTDGGRAASAEHPHVDPSTPGCT